MADQYHLKFDASKGQAVDDYLEYKRIVGEDDGGKLFTPEEFEEYKKKVLPMHTMIVENAEEREARGHPLGEATPYAAMGGITGFSSLAEGYQRLDPSGKGAPNKGFLEQSVTSSDNPFLRGNVHAIRQHQMNKKEKGHITGPEDEIFDDIGERVSSRRRDGEDDMAYFERRYQERQRNQPSGTPIDTHMGRLNLGSRQAFEEKPRSGRKK